MSKSADAEIAALRRRNPQLVISDTAPRPPIALSATEAAALGMTGDLGGAVPLEHDEQAALFAWADAAQGEHPELAMLHATPNGGYRPMATAAKLKAEGVKAGYPDISLDVPCGRFHGLRIELKRANHSNGPTPAQKEWIDALRNYGYAAVIAYGADEAINVITAYLAQE